jgi:hypothetical protein
VLYGRPSAVVMDLPLAADGVMAHAPWIAATARPWPGALALSRRTGSSAFSFNRLIEARATMGVLTSAAARGPLHVIDRGTSFTVRLTTGALSSVSLEEMLQGANAAAIGSVETGFEIVQFQRAELVGPRSYRLSLLLRGRQGSEPEMAMLRPAGARFVLLDQAVVQPQLSLAQGALSQEWRIGPAQYDEARARTALLHRGRRLGLRPLAPCHLKAERLTGGVLIGWIRRSRFDSDEWEEGDVPLGEERESYRVEILNGASLRRRVSVAEPSCLYPAAQVAADFGAGPQLIGIRVQQLSTSFGPGAAVERTIHV